MSSAREHPKPRVLGFGFPSVSRVSRLGFLYWGSRVAPSGLS